MPLTVRDPNTAGRRVRRSDAAVAVLGRRGDLDEQEQRPQSDDRRARAACGSRRPCVRRTIPTFCKAGSTHPSAKLFPLARSGRQLAMYDPKTKKLTHIGTCFSTHHLMFAEDANNTLWTSGGGPVVGWLNTKMFDETGDEEKSQGWTALILDTNGNGKRDEYVEPNQPVDPTKDKRINAGFYSVAPAPDGSIWGSSLGFPGGDRPPDAGRESAGDRARRVLRAAVQQPEGAGAGLLAARRDIDRNGVVWVALASGHMASFDRRKCKGPLNGPTATGQHCPEGWTLYTGAAAAVQGRDRVRQRRGELLHLGRSVRHARTRRRTRRSTPATRPRGCSRSRTASGSILRVPYPMGFYTKWMDGRIDDPNAGWKGRGLWATVEHARAVPHGDGQGHDEQGAALPAAADSAVAVVVGR